MALVYLCAAWLTGIWASPVLSLPWQGATLSSAAAISIGLLWRRRQMAALLAGLCVAAVLAGMVRYQMVLPATGPSHLSYYNGRDSAELQGWVSDEPDIRDRSVRLRLEVFSARVDGRWLETEGTALVVAPRYPQRSYGEVLRVAGKLEAPERLNGFDYPSYLARQGIYSIMTFPKIGALDERKGFGAWNWLLEFKERLARNLARALPEPQAALAQGILLGLRSSIPQDLMDAFNRSGATHIIVISGHNLTLLAGYLVIVGQPLIGRRRALWFSLAGILVYTILVGAQSPVVRASIMGGIFILGTYLGRQRDAVIPLALAAAGMAAFQPLLLWDVSFQLSFAATAGLIILAPPIQASLQRLWPSSGGVRQAAHAGARSYLIESLAVTLAATAAVLPLLLVNFQRLSIVAPLANLLVLPALPGIMLTGTLTSGLGFLEPLGQVAGWTAWPFLTYMVAVVELLAKLPLAAIEVQGFLPELALSYYSLLALAKLWLHKTRYRE